MIDPPTVEPQRPDAPLDGRFAGRAGVVIGREVSGWAGLALATLGGAGILALLIGFLRVPGADAIAPWPVQEVFDKGLIAHVTLAFVVWYLAVQGALTVLATGEAALSNPVMQRAGILALRAAQLGVILLVIPVFFNMGEVSKNNYVPVLTTPPFYAGLALVAGAVAILVARLLVTIGPMRRAEPVSFAIAVAGVIYLIALTCIGLAAIYAPQGIDTHGQMEHLFWGGGHVWQFAVTTLFFAALTIITRTVLGETPVSPRLFKGLCLFMLAGAAPGAMFYFVYAPGDVSLRIAFTHLYWVALAIPAGILTISFAVLLLRRWTDTVGGLPEGVGAIAVLLLFALGGVFGYFEGSTDTRTPAHYHAVLVAVTVTFMALYFVLFLPLTGKPVVRPRWRALSYVLLAGGQGLHSLGLFVAGWAGAARKTAGAGHGADGWIGTVSLSVMGVGGLIAVIGGVIFVLSAWRGMRSPVEG